MAEQRTGYRGGWKKWVAIYAVAAVVIYLIVYFVFFHHGGGYGGGSSGGGGYWASPFPPQRGRSGRAGSDRPARRSERPAVPAGSG
ncbi:MAG: hypothetical protein M3Q23_13385 [Actinomycetota bacterium]|nr:hypothetical protein [Actinomycetota bacterium]